MCGKVKGEWPDETTSPRHLEASRDTFETSLTYRPGVCRVGTTVPGNRRGALRASWSAGVRVGPLTFITGKIDLPTLRRRLRRAERAAHPAGCLCTIRLRVERAAHPGGCLCTIRLRSRARSAPRRVPLHDSFTHRARSALRRVPLHDSFTQQSCDGHSGVWLRRTRDERKKPDPGV